MKNPSGKAEARNAGVAVAKSDTIVISDADMVPGPDFVQAHYRHIRPVRMLVALKAWRII